jgi:acrylyl-CoA reductase (NADPH)
VTTLSVPEQISAVRTTYLKEEKRVESTLVSLSLDDLSAGEVVIRNHYAGVNYKDCLAVTGKAKIIESYPRIAGIEVVGQVVSSASPAFAVGQIVTVHGFQTGIRYDGGFAEFVRAPADHVMAIPDGLTPWETAMIGVPGFTVAMALERFQALGITPASGPVAVSGATGAVGMLALQILSRAGYQVVALTRRPVLAPMLVGLGAAEVMDISGIGEQTRLVEQPRFAAAIDNVSGPTLSWLLRSLKDNGALASVGNASGNAFDCNVLPFILRNACMFGVVANASWDVRKRLWQRLANDWRPDFSTLAPHVHTIPLHELLPYSERHLQGQSSGRTLVKFNA